MVKDKKIPVKSEQELREYIKKTLAEEHLWKPGERDTFAFGIWKCSLEKEKDTSKDYSYTIFANAKKGSAKIGIGESYPTMEEAFLDVVNEFITAFNNESAEKKYKTLKEFIEPKGHPNWCGENCSVCTKYCALDEAIPCSPDCQNLNPITGEPDSEECKSCDAYLMNKR